jgi:hypothetical protein
LANYHAIVLKDDITIAHGVARIAKA